MKLSATQIDAGDSGELLHFGFYDSELTYGVGLTKFHEENRIELMVADQSVYDLEDAKIIFKPEYFELNLKKGTIREIDGEDNYLIRYSKMENEIYFERLKYLKQIVEGREDIELEHS